ncbi:Monogalactosyldiacylglycerol synthase family protein [Candidatus Promineifilum breve]|uniref:Monogalactosyldiacylglycerol synthase family protein n=1 Tax=Candidatus Promineifilum breve TaxID=1806508 RepID=A0A160T3Q3_9CHLR|nr:glycosyltransferase [Candidatus Promineifilum breve]CUS03170.2 Monogalactosyldiacylglycerol synthase family protein [Candidatus Promineifilum breve]
MTNASGQNILILTNDAGMGHRQAAQATVAALERRAGDSLRPVLVNPLEEPGAPPTLRNLQSDFNRLVQRAPALYSLGHEVGNGYLPTRLMERLETRLLGETIDRILRSARPAIVVATHPTYIYLLVDYRKRQRQPWSLAVLVTDLARLQRLWFRKEVDLYLVPTDEAAALAVRRGIRPERVHVTGIPVDLRLAEAAPLRPQLRAQYGWDAALPLILAVGSRRVVDFMSVLQALNEARLPIQLAVVTGDDEELLREVGAIDWQIPTHLYGYVDDLPLRLRAADAVITKAGGLTVAESLAAGTPLFIIQSTPMHEQGNAAYVVAGGAGLRAENPADLADALRGALANDCRLLTAMADNARRLGRPRAAYDVAEQLWTLGQRAATDPQPVTADR